jgi:hypothetical protein
VAADTRLHGALRALVAALNELPVPSMIIGGVAVIAAGVPRQTIDIDAAVLGRGSDLVSVIAGWNATALRLASPTRCNSPAIVRSCCCDTTQAE